MNCKEIFNYFIDRISHQNINYVILHSYQKLPFFFDSDVDIAIDVDKIDSAIKILDRILRNTGWRIVQFWRHEYYAADCIISNDNEFLQIDFCIHYERNGRVLLPVSELVSNHRRFKNFRVPALYVEYTYILIKKILKKNFSDTSKIQLAEIFRLMSPEEKNKAEISMKRFLTKKNYSNVLKCIENEKYSNLDIEKLNCELRRKTSGFKSNIHYFAFDILRKIERIKNPTGFFIVLLGVDGSGKTTIANELLSQYAGAFRRVKHYHSRVRILKDISQIGTKSEPMDVTDPHSKKKKAGKVISLMKFCYYFLDYLIGNLIITKAKIQSSLILMERYYYDYYIDTVRYNLNLPSGFLKFFERFVKKPDIIFILTGNSQILIDRKKEISLEEIEKQKQKQIDIFTHNPKAVFIDTTEAAIDDCVKQMMKKCNTIMRGRREWQM